MKITVEIPDNLAKRLSITASARGVKNRDIVIKALESELDDDSDKRNIEKIMGKRKDVL